MMTRGSFAPSRYQQAIFEAVQQGCKALVVSAVPGSGKTTTSKELIRYLPADATVLALAFNVDAAAQLQKKINEMLKDMQREGLATPMVDSRTIHSLGNATLVAANLKSSVKPTKYTKLCREYLKYRNVQNPNTVQHLAKLIDMVRLTLSGTDERSLKWLCNRFEIDLDFSDDETWPIILQAVPYLLDAGIEQCQEDRIIDYTDMIWIPYMLKLQPRRFDYVLVDEAQDLSPAQRALVLKARKKDSAFIAVGDRHQCQPAGTMVRLSDGTEKPIEMLVPGNTVYSFDRRSSAYVRSAVVTETASRHYDGQLYTISAGGRQVRCTNSHKWLVRWTEGADAWITYLMRQGTRYRIGQTRMFVHQAAKGQGDFGLAIRARVERADEAWILKIHHSYSEALAYEQIIAATYGLPEVCFNEASGIQHFTQEMIDYIYTSLPSLEERVQRCLEAHGRKIEYPLYTRNGMNGYIDNRNTSGAGGQQRQGRTTLFETQACNLISGYMAIPVAGDSIRAVHDKLQWETITVTSETYTGQVYSLNVAKHHKYIANGLVTLNSIYGFAGASLVSIDEIIKETRATEMPLSICYRCPKSVVDLAASIYPGIEAAPDTAEGTIEYILPDGVANRTRPGDLILCRLTAPLVEECLRLLRMGKRANVRGKDLGKSFISLLEQVEKFSRGQLTMLSLETCVQNYARKQFEALGRHAEENEMKISSLEDKITTLLVLHEAYIAQTELEERTLDGFLNYITAFFAEDKDAQIILSTGHRAKGLEYPRVFILGADRLPHPRAKTPEAIIQEYNLMYVMYTRTHYDQHIEGSGTLFLVVDRLPLAVPQLPTEATHQRQEEDPQPKETLMASHAEEIQPKHAGGRPRKDRVRVNIKLDTDLAERTQKIDRSELINMLLRKHFDELDR